MGQNLVKTFSSHAVWDKYKCFIMNVKGSFRVYNGYLGQLRYILLMPLFFLVFSLYYNPFNIQGYFDFGMFTHIFHLLMLTSILFVSMIITRTVFYLIRKNFVLWWQYCIFCVAEMFFVSCFAALYISLFKTSITDYFVYFFVSLKCAFSILVYPYCILAVLREFREASILEPVLQSVNDDSRIKFVDAHNRLKLTIDKKSFLSIEAGLNYITISYVENGNVKEFLLRNSMKSQEENAVKFGFVRCHRSFYVNPAFVKV